MAFVVRSKNIWQSGWVLGDYHMRYLALATVQPHPAPLSAHDAAWHTAPSRIAHC